MPLLDRYLFKQFTKYFFLVLCALTAIYFLVDFFERIDNFMAAQKPMGMAFKYFVLKIPFMADMIYPVCILLAGVITLGVLNHNHEFMALKAGGVSSGRICVPLLAASIFFTLGALAMSEWILPETLKETNRIWYEEINKAIPKGVERKGRIYHRGQKGIYSFIRTNVKKDVFSHFSYSEWDENYNISMHLTAQKAIWQDGQWTLLDGQLKTPTELATPTKQKIDIFARQVIELPESPQDFFVPAYIVNEQSISSLFQKAVSTETDRKQAWLNFNKRLSFIVIGLPLVLIGLPILLIINQKWGKDLTLAIPISCGIAFAAWGWWSTAQSLTKAYDINPAISAWSIHILVGLLGAWLLKRQDA